MDEKIKERSLVPLYVTNFFGVMNDNFLKTLGGFLAIGWIADKRLQSVVMGVVGAALVLPYILCSPLADRLTVLFRKRQILQFAKWAELPIMLIAISGFAMHSVSVVVVSIVLMGLQSSLYSPAKYALIRDIAGEGRISTGMGGMEGVAFLAMLSGTVLASYVADLEGSMPSVKAWCLLGFAVLGLAGSFTVVADETKSRAIHAVNPFRYLRRVRRMVGNYDGLNHVIVALSTFWFAAAMLQMGLLVYGRQAMGLSSTQTGMVLALAAVGIVAGQVIAGFVDRSHYLLGATVFTGWIGAAILYVLFVVPMNVTVFSALVALLAFDMGFFKLPFDTEIQKRVKGPKLNTVLSYFNQVSFLFMLGASAAYSLVSWLWGPSAFLLVLAATLTVVPVWFVFHSRGALAATGRAVLGCRYRVRKDGFELFTPDGTYLVLPNHVAIVDPMLVFAELGRFRISPLCDELYFSNPIAAAFLKTYDAVMVPDLRRHRTAAGVKAVMGLKDVILGALASGHGVLFYPSGHIRTEDREEIGTRQLAHNVCSALPEGVRVIGVRTTGLWGSIWSRAGRRNTPPFLPTLVKSVCLWIACLFTRRHREVGMHFEDLTNRIAEWAKLPRAEFNRKLEEWYNMEV